MGDPHCVIEIVKLCVLHLCFWFKSIWHGFSSLLQTSTPQSDRRTQPGFGSGSGSIFCDRRPTKQRHPLKVMICVIRRRLRSEKKRPVRDDGSEGSGDHWILWEASWWICKNLFVSLPMVTLKKNNVLIRQSVDISVFISCYLPKLTPRTHSFQSPYCACTLSKPTSRSLQNCRNPLVSYTAHSSADLR